MIDVDAVREGFRRRFGAEADVVVRSPGRVNLIGEHVDYNDGLVLPAAIDRGTLVAARALPEPRVEAASADLPGTLNIALATLLAISAEERAQEPGWAPYVRGVLGLLSRPASGGGLQLFIQGDLPVGAGLSSSASLELGVAVAAQALGWPPQSALENALVCQRAENEVAGVRCGIMDQLAVAAGVVDHALLLDCRSLAFEPVPLPTDARVLILDSAAPRTLAGSAYNNRRAACEESARVLGMGLRDAADQGVDLSRLPAALRPRARHVVTEIERTRAMVRALARGALAEAGALMRASHESLRIDYEVSSVALDTLVEEASRESAVFGARLTGAGFGGCVVALIRADAPADLADAILDRYRGRTGLVGRAFVVRASAGAHVAWRGSVS